MLERGGERDAAAVAVCECCWSAATSSCINNTRLEADTIDGIPTWHERPLSRAWVAVQNAIWINEGDSSTNVLEIRLLIFLAEQVEGRAGDGFRVRGRPSLPGLMGGTGTKCEK